MPGFLRFPRSRIGSLVLAGIFLLLTVIAAIRLHSGWQSSSAQASATCPGDSNLDKSFDVRDMVVILGHILKRETLDGEAQSNADVNQDGQINVQDIVRLMQHNLGRSPLADCPTAPPKMAPWVRFITPRTGPIGSKVTISGSGFSPTPSLNKVTFHNPDPVSQAQVTSAAENGLEVVVPSGLENTLHAVTVEVDELESNAGTFEITDTVEALGISPSLVNILLPPGTGKEVLVVGGGTPPYKLKPLSSAAVEAAEISLQGSVITLIAKADTWTSSTLEVAVVDLVSFALQEYLATGRPDVETFIDGDTVDFDRYSVAFADALDLSPFTKMTGDVVFAAGIQFLFEKRFVFRPPELVSSVRSVLAAFGPSRFPVGCYSRLRG